MDPELQNEYNDDGYYILTSDDIYGDKIDN